MGDEKVSTQGNGGRRRSGSIRCNMRSKYAFVALSLFFIIPSLKIASMTSNQTSEYIARSNQIYMNFVGKGLNKAAKSMSPFGGGPTSLGDLTLLPKPTEVQHCQGKFHLNEKTKIKFSHLLIEHEATMLAKTLRRSTGLPIPTMSNRADNDTPHIFLTVQEAKKQSSKIDESYQLKVSPERVEIKSTTRNGIFYGTQTLLQLLPPKIYSFHPIRKFDWEIPCVSIQDGPVYSWRGMMMDSARHFFSAEYTKKFLDLMAMHKMNRFHWHLNDDQGWRIEIPKYPKLMEISAWRNATLVGHHENPSRKKYDGKRHGGYYLRSEIRDIVAYAAERHIQVIPEIEMPGHTQAVFAAYPEFGCLSDFHFHVKQHWGISKELYCAGNEDTFEFLQNVLLDVMDLFPGPYIHIGGDEAPKIRWMSCSKCQARMKAEGLSNEQELQSYFIKRIAKFLARFGKKIIGWDEITEGDLPANATVMSWRGVNPGFGAVEKGFDTIFTPFDFTYFDGYQAKPEDDEPLAQRTYVPLERVYKFDPQPENSDISRSKLEKHVLGIQGQLWSEFLESPKKLEYQAFPRMSALAENMWHKKSLDYDEFVARLQKGHLPRLATLGVNYRVPDEKSLRKESEMIPEEDLVVDFEVAEENPWP